MERLRSVKPSTGTRGAPVLRVGRLGTNCSLGLVLPSSQAGLYHGAMPTPTVAQHFQGRTPEVKATYAAILKVAKKLGPFTEDPKKTSIHLNRKSAFAGVATRKQALILTVKSAKALNGQRIVKSEQVSASRWHVEVRLESPSDVNATVSNWIAAAYELSA
jgi:Domain of unknown function (DUF5655)